MFFRVGIGPSSFPLLEGSKSVGPALRQSVLYILFLLVPQRVHVLLIFCTLLTIIRRVHARVLLGFIMNTSKLHGINLCICMLFSRIPAHSAKMAKISQNGHSARNILIKSCLQFLYRMRRVSPSRDQGATSINRFIGSVDPPHSIEEMTTEWKIFRPLSCTRGPPSRAINHHTITPPKKLSCVFHCEHH